MVSGRRPRLWCRRVVTASKSPLFQGTAFTDGTLYSCLLCCAARPASVWYLVVHRGCVCAVSDVQASCMKHHSQATHGTSTGTSKCPHGRVVTASNSPHFQGTAFTDGTLYWCLLCSESVDTLGWYQAPSVTNSWYFEALCSVDIFEAEGVLLCDFMPPQNERDKTGFHQASPVSRPGYFLAVPGSVLQTRWAAIKPHRVSHSSYLEVTRL